MVGIQKKINFGFWTMHQKLVALDFSNTLGPLELIQDYGLNLTKDI